VTGLPEGLLPKLRDALGPGNVTTDPAELDYYSKDMSYRPFTAAAAVTRPRTADEVATNVELCHAAEVPVVARGGGMTYTGAYTPAREGTVLIDMSRLDRIVEVNEQDLYVTVECGCTWERLYLDLRERGLRTPFAGTSSGRYATVGGTLSTNGVFMGCSRYGSAADSVLGLDVVLAGGTPIRTGSGAHRDGLPFFRYFGPDLSGIFLADTGAFGIKTSATLKLIPIPEFAASFSISFDSFAASIDAMAEMAPYGLASEIYSLDPRYHRALVDFGFSFMEGIEWSVHGTVEAADEHSAQAGSALLGEIGRRHGQELDPTFPTTVRDDPFDGVRWALLNRDGQIWMPTHGIVPFSRAHETANEVQALLDREAETLERYGITTSYQSVVVGPHWIFEVAFYWADEVGRFRLEKLDPGEAERFASIPADLEVRGEGLRLRREASDVFARLGGVQLQIGRYYDFESVLQPSTWDTLGAIKHALDPQGLVNPGSLGLAS
jgi:FAD/FMN-containing dehydrogenase